jgi:hypothetical protein
VTADRKVAVADDCEEVTVARTAAEELFESPPPGAEENSEEGLPPFPENSDSPSNTLRRRYWGRGAPS